MQEKDETIWEWEAHTGDIRTETRWSNKGNKKNNEWLTKLEIEEIKWNIEEGIDIVENDMSGRK